MTAAQYISINAGPDLMARNILSHIRGNRMIEAARESVEFAACYGHKLPEAHVLRAIVLEKAGLAEEALASWDSCVRNFPLRTSYLEAAIRFAWRLGDNARIREYWRKWRDLLAAIFISPPSIQILREFGQRGDILAGCCGVHMGRAHAWLWLKKGEKPVIHTDLQAEYARRLHSSLMTDGQSVLQVLSIPLPELAKPYAIAITDGSGRHIGGSPIVCSPRRNVSHAWAKTRQTPLTVIIPVYDDRKATLSCLGSVFASRKNCRVPFDILVAWDHGPDRQLLADLQKLALRDKIRLLQTPHNYGFLATVNHAISCVAGGDVILLNSDTLVHGDWIDRMVKAAAMPNAATVTAMGSQAEHMSYPSWSNRADVRSLRQTAAIDNACRDIPDSVLEIPAGVGFCMLITRRALSQCGTLDGLAVCKGYGEESDFCLRARKAGFINYGAFNVFVAHLQGRSFGAAKKALSAQNNKAIRARFPYYEKEFDAFLNADPSREIKEGIAARLCRALPPVRLEIRPWSQNCAPCWDHACKVPPNARPRAALFILSLTGREFLAQLKVRCVLSMPDMNFRLPRDCEKLNSALANFAEAEIVELKSPALQLALRFFPQAGVRRASIKPDVPDLPPGDNYIAAPPQNPGQARWLRGFLARNLHAMVYIYKLKKFLRAMPMPPNARELPELENLSQLRPSALILFSGCEGGDWQDWLKRMDLTSLPTYVPEVG